MLAGTWILALLPLLDVMTACKWGSNLRVPNVLGLPGALTLGDTFLSNMGVYQSLVFCIGVVLLFSKERGRRFGRLDWTRRWGVLCSYVVLLLSAVRVLYVAALVLLGITAVFLAMPPKYQPGVTQLLIDMSTAYLRYGPHPKYVAEAVLVAFSSITMLLACIALFDALRSSGAKWVAAILLAPLAVFAVMYLVQAAGYCLGSSGWSLGNDLYPGVYFRPQLPVAYIAGVPTYTVVSGAVFCVEAAKWCIILAIAIWLSIAQLAAWRRGKKASAG